MNKLCDKCGGYMNYEKDYDGDFWECINCGKHINISFNKGVTQYQRNPLWGVQSKTKYTGGYNWNDYSSR